MLIEQDFFFFFLPLIKFPSFPSASFLTHTVPPTPILFFLTEEFAARRNTIMTVILACKLPLTSMNTCCKERIASAVTVVVMQKPDGICRNLHDTPFLCKGRASLYLSGQGCFGFVQFELCDCWN